MHENVLHHKLLHLWRVGVPAVLQRLLAVLFQMDIMVLVGPRLLRRLTLPHLHVLFPSPHPMKRFIFEEGVGVLEVKKLHELLGVLHAHVVHERVGLVHVHEQVNALRHRQRRFSARVNDDADILAQLRACELHHFNVVWHELVGQALPRVVRARELQHPCTDAFDGAVVTLHNALKARVVSFLQEPHGAACTGARGVLAARHVMHARHLLHVRLDVLQLLESFGRHRRNLHDFWLEALSHPHVKLPNVVCILRKRVEQCPARRQEPQPRMSVEVLHNLRAAPIVLQLRLHEVGREGLWPEAPRHREGADHLIRQLVVLLWRGLVQHHSAVNSDGVPPRRVFGARPLVHLIDYDTVNLSLRAALREVREVVQHIQTDAHCEASRVLPLRPTDDVLLERGEEADSVLDADFFALNQPLTIVQPRSCGVREDFEGRDGFKADFPLGDVLHHGVALLIGLRLPRRVVNCGGLKVVVACKRVKASLQESSTVDVGAQNQRFGNEGPKPVLLQ